MHKRYALVIRTDLPQDHWENCMSSCLHVLNDKDFPVEDVFRIPTTSSFLFNADEAGVEAVREHFGKETASVYELK